MEPFTGFFKEVSTTHSAADIFERIQEEPNSVFLDSGMSVGSMGRYSIIARDPFLTFSSKNRTATVTSFGNKTIFEDTDPFAMMKELLSKYKIPPQNERSPFMGGAIGYLGYDLGRILEKLPENSVDDLNIPDCYFGFYDAALIFDHLHGKTHIISTGFPQHEDALRRDRAAKRLKEYEDLLQQTFATGPIPSPPAIQGEIKKQFSEEHYCKSVQRAIDYIFAGDIFQVNFTQRFQGELHEPPYQLYKRFRSINPAPYGCYLHFPDVIVASGSPERFILVRGRQVETRPIKGTRPRCGDLEKDQKSRAELLVSEKDRAELVMIIDLERNDLGRVCEIGSVRVPDLITLEEYPTVYHLVSTVVGTLRPGDTAIDLIKAAFPGGSITGAPKIRAMEIIDELEPVRRGIYTGSIGYIDFSGDADFNIVIRTFVIKGNQVYFQAGGGIVSDSSPQQEYQESLDKARALMRAFGCKEV